MAKTKRIAKHKKLFLVLIALGLLLIILLVGRLYNDPNAYLNLPIGNNIVHMSLFQGIKFRITSTQPDYPMGTQVENKVNTSTQSQSNSKSQETKLATMNYKELSFTYPSNWSAPFGPGGIIKSQDSQYAKGGIILKGLQIFTYYSTLENETYHTLDEYEKLFNIEDPKGPSEYPYPQRYISKNRIKIDNLDGLELISEGQTYAGPLLVKKSWVVITNNKLLGLACEYNGDSNEDSVSRCNQVLKSISISL